MVGQCSGYTERQRFDRHDVAFTEDDSAVVFEFELRWKQRSESLDQIRLRVTRASASYWHALYIPPVVGRYFNESEDQPGAEPVVVLSHVLWQSHFAGRRDIVGRTVTLNGIAHTVVGVAPPEYALSPQSAQSPSIWLPLAMTASQIAEHSDHELQVVGLLRRGVSQGAAIAQLTRIETSLAQQYPHSYFDGGIVATPLREAVVGDIRLILLILFGAVGLVLLIGCANVANLLLARAAVRQKEMAIRSALGGARRRILRQLLVESMVLALGGAVVGLIIAAVGVRFLVRSAPANIPRLQDVALDGPMLTFTVLLAVFSGVASGLVPALRASRADLRGALNQGSREGAGSLRYGLRASLVVGQVSVALVLLVGAGLLLRSAMLLQNVPPGFETKNVLVASISLPDARYETDEAVAAAFYRIATAISAGTGVASAGMISRIPIGASGMDCAVRPEGTTTTDDRNVSANQRSATPALFQTLGIPMMRGRGFTAADRTGALPVVVINRSLARRLYGSVDPIGKRLTSCTGNESAPISRTVVGVIGDVHANGLANDPPNELYYPLEQRVERTMMLVVHGVVPATTLMPNLRNALTVIDPLLPLSGVITMEEVVARSLAVPRFTTLLLGLLGSLGLVLAIIGIYGVIAYFVVQRTREIGVRIALGALPAGVVRLVVWQGVALVVTGIVIGLATAWLLARVLEQMLFQVSAHDPTIFGGVASLLLVVAIAASGVPAWRAARVNPLIAMRA